MHAERDTVLPILSVCPSVCEMPVLCQTNGHIITIFTLGYGHHSSPTAVTKLQGEPRSGALNVWGWEIFGANFALYLQNGKRA